MKLYVNADDFGAEECITQGIDIAFRSGYINHATIMCNGETFDRAVELSHQNGYNDRIGIHMNLTRGYPLSDLIKREPFFCNLQAGTFEYMLHGKSISS